MLAKTYAIYNLETGDVFATAYLEGGIEPAVDEGCGYFETQQDLIGTHRVIDGVLYKVKERKKLYVGWEEVDITPIPVNP